MKRFESISSNITFFCDIKTCLFRRVNFSAIPLLIYMNDSSKTSNKGGFYLYADDICISYQHNYVEETKKVLFKEFSSLCEWFTDNKLSIQFGADKTEAIKNSWQNSTFHSEVTL